MKNYFIGCLLITMLLNSVSIRAERLKVVWNGYECKSKSLRIDEVNAIFLETFTQCDKENKYLDFSLAVGRSDFRLTEEQLVKLGLNDRQIKAVEYAKEKGKITNKEYQELNKVSKRTAAYELIEMVEKHKIFKQIGASVGTYYEI